MSPKGQYIALAPIGEGGMATICLGLKTGAAQFSRWVAIKRVHSRWLNNETFLNQFRKEIRLNAAVIHPNVVQILDVVETDRELHLVMEYVNGVTFGTLMTEVGKRNGFLAIDVAVAVCVAMLRGLHAAHSAQFSNGQPLNIVHRDVSPQNIMIDRCGQVRLLDFGLANAKGQPRFEQEGVLAGKIAYFAPEQVEGRTNRQTDVFSAGVVLWESLVGRRLFRHSGCSDESVIQMVLSSTIPRPSESRDAVSAALDAVVLRALNRDPRQRYSNAEQFADALENAVSIATPKVISNTVLEFCTTPLVARDELLARAYEQIVGPLAASSVAIELITEESLLHSPSPNQVVRRSNWPIVLTALVACAALSISGLWAFTTRKKPPTSADFRRPLGDEPVLSAFEGHWSEQRTERPHLRTNVPDLSPGGLKAKRRSVARQSQKSPRSVAMSTPVCTPPTYLDRRGIRHFKKGCL